MKWLFAQISVLSFHYLENSSKDLIVAYHLLPILSSAYHILTELFTLHSLDIREQPLVLALLTTGLYPHYISHNTMYLNS